MIVFGLDTLDDRPLIFYPFTCYFAFELRATIIGTNRLQKAPCLGTVTFDGLKMHTVIYLTFLRDPAIETCEIREYIDQDKDMNLSTIKVRV